MITPPTCPRCASALPADSPEGLCPACLMSGAFGTGSETVKLSGPAPLHREAPKTPTPEELAPLFPDLQILELLGRGGMGAVYKARQKNLNRVVALKILPVDVGANVGFAERFQREAQALAKLNHPNIVTVFEVGENQGLFYFLMEFVDGANLRALIRAGEMTPQAMLALIPAFCDALQYAHDEGVVHRDIKPENVLVDKNGRVKIADFGLAKMLGHEGASPTLTRTGMHLGTPRYMAPEQLDKPETVDHRADIYSLGIVFYEMLTGEVPMGRFEPPSKRVNIDVKLDEIVLHAMEREPERRYQRASEIKTDVELLGQRGAPAEVARKALESLRDVGGDATRSWIFAFGMLLVVWLLPALLWNFRKPGCAIALLLMGGIFTLLALRLMKRQPELVENWKDLSRSRQAVRLAGGVMIAALGYLFLLGAMEIHWEASPLHWNAAGQSSEEFGTSIKGEEYKLVRQLAAFKESVPTVELSPNGATWTGGWNVLGVFGAGGPHNKLFNVFSVLGSLAMSIWCLASAPAAVVSPARFRRRLMGKSQWLALRTALPLTGAALLSGLCIYLLLFVFHLFTLSSPRESLATLRFSVAQEPAAVREALKEWAAQEGYALGDLSKWDLNTVPKGEKLGEVSLSQAWKPSPFDRWRMTWRGLEKATPHLVLKTISTDKPIETVIQITVGVPPNDEDVKAEWQVALASLESAIKRAGDSNAGTGTKGVKHMALQREMVSFMLGRARIALRTVGHHM